jgi:hypothetical protein
MFEMKSSREQIELANHHIDAMISPDIQEEFGLTKGRDLHMRVLRLCDAFNELLFAARMAQLKKDHNL